MMRALLPILLGPALLACDPSTAPTTKATSTVSARPSAGAAPKSAPALRTLRAAELRRDSSLIQQAHLQSRNPSERRAAVRALARIANPNERQRLESALHDEDPEVVTWAAFGLGELCARGAEATVNRLAANLNRWREEATEKASSAAITVNTFARAIGRCNHELAERTLLEWALRRDATSRAAIQALGELLAKRPRPREETLVALLNLASGDAKHKPIPYALYPLGRRPLPSNVAVRTREVALAQLKTRGPDRIHAVRALARSDDAATASLQQILGSPSDYNASERAEAARALAKRGSDGQKALRAALAELIPATDDPLAATNLVGPNFGPLLLALQSLNSIGSHRKTLRQYARLAAPPKAPAPLRRRLSWLRCSAAQILAERKFDDPFLTKCDLDAAADKEGLINSSIGARSIVSAIGIEGTRIRGKRYRLWLAYATRGPMRARQQAIQLMNDHDELKDTAKVLSQALSSKLPGLVAVASEVIRKTPDRAYERTKGNKRALSPQLVKALLSELNSAALNRDLESLAAAMAAAAALRMESALPVLQRLCRDPYVGIRTQAAKALSRLEGKKRVCDRPRTSLATPIELKNRLHGKVRVTLATDAGQLQLELDADVAPIAVTRLVDLIRRGFYDGNIVHRVVPGFVTQFGSPSADGYGGDPQRPAIPCEPSPRTFDAMNVGVALAGRDTGSSQFFVTHESYPHLDGRYSWIGRASGPWASLVDGDRIIKASVGLSANTR